jgi:hypothetical protein
MFHASVPNRDFVQTVLPKPIFALFNSATSGFPSLALMILGKKERMHELENHHAHTHDAHLSTLSLLRRLGTGMT